MKQSSSKQPHSVNVCQQHKQTVLGRLTEVRLLMAGLRRIRKAESERDGTQRFAIPSHSVSRKLPCYYDP
jgi:hypothetical protein